MKIDLNHFSARYHSHGGLLSVAQAPYIGLAEDWIRAAQEHGFNRTDLNAEYTEGTAGYDTLT
jgi:hypothetical protein